MDKRGAEDVSQGWETIIKIALIVASILILSFASYNVLKGILR